jgi:hypothetical protein
VDRREIDDEFSGARRRRKAVAAEHHVLHSSGIGEAHKDDVGGVGNLARMGGSLRARLYQCGGFAGRPVPDRDVVACVEQAPRHRKSHHPKSEIAELFSLLSVRPANPSHCISPFFAAIKARPACRLYHTSPPCRAIASKRRWLA